MRFWFERNNFNKGSCRWNQLIPCHILALFYKPCCVRKSHPTLFGILHLSWCERFSTSVRVCPSPLNLPSLRPSESNHRVGGREGSGWKEETFIRNPPYKIMQAPQKHMSHSLSKERDKNSRGKRTESRHQKEPSDVRQTLFLMKLMELISFSYLLALANSLWW